MLPPELWANRRRPAEIATKFYERQYIILLYMYIVCAANMFGRAVVVTYTRCTRIVTNLYVNSITKSTICILSIVQLAAIELIMRLTAVRVYLYIR
jgi:hypothetical protein